jgi:hypothetical protein
LSCKPSILERAKDADEVRRNSGEQALRVGMSAKMLEDLPDLYLRLGDEEEARKMLDQLVTVAAKLYQTDADLSDPNQAFKVWWPSANLWWACITFAGKLNPSPAEQIIEGVRDDEIKTFERVAFANSLLGAPTARFSIIEKHKHGVTAFMRQ